MWTFNSTQEMFLSDILIFVNLLLLCNMIQRVFHGVYLAILFKATLIMI